MNFPIARPARCFSGSLRSWFVSGVVMALAGALPAAPARPTNVLMIIVDDLNAWTGFMGRNPQVKTPQMDALAARGVSFSHAYDAAPQCTPSRAALFSGLRPFETGVYANGIGWENKLNHDLTLEAQLHKAGYWIGAAGKVHEDVEQTVDAYQPSGPLVEAKVLDSGRRAPQSWKILDSGDEGAEDESTVRWICDQLGRPHDKPVFLIAGLRKPHVPWNIPKKYYDLYPLADVKLPPIKEDDLDDIDLKAVAGIFRESNFITGIKDDELRPFVRAYLSAVSYADAQVGRILAALEAGPYKDNTLVILWGDNGFHLGEKHAMAKRLLWEEANRVPLIFAGQGIKLQDISSPRVVDFMTMYPTICDLLGLPVPEHVKGKSLRPLLENPAGAWKDFAMSSYLPGNHTIRTDRWRYIRYANGSEELYDEAADPYEWTNLAKNPNYAAIRADFARQLPTTEKPLERITGPVRDN
jgi:arylsulfatase A-like enzyme